MPTYKVIGSNKKPPSYKIPKPPTSPYRIPPKPSPPRKYRVPPKPKPKYRVALKKTHQPARKPLRRRRKPSFSFL